MVLMVVITVVGLIKPGNLVSVTLTGEVISIVKTGGVLITVVG